MITPRGSFEWGAVLTATAVVITIALLYAAPWERTESAQPFETGVTAAVAGVATPLPRTPLAPPPPRPPAFTLRATGGDSWLSVRSGSYRGRVLFEGVLLDGRTLTLRAPRLWIRFGAAAYVTLSIDGRPVGLPAFGTFDALAGPGGVRQDRTVYATAAQSP